MKSRTRVNPDLVAADFLVLRKWITDAQNRELQILEELDSLKKELQEVARQAGELQTLNEARDRWQDEAEDLKHQLDDLKESRTYRLGAALRDSRNMRGLLALPRRVTRLLTSTGGNPQND